MRKRGFERVSDYKDVNLPVRQTGRAAGYDFEAAEDVVIPSIWEHIGDMLFGNDIKPLKATLIPTGVKAYMLEDEYLQLSIRSGMALKTGLGLANGIGVVDADYYNNDDNEGHIMFAVRNFGFKEKVIKKGERVGQGVFLQFLKADNDVAVAKRGGGFGSTGSASKKIVVETDNSEKMVATN